MIGRPGLTALLLMAGVLPAAEDLITEAMHRGPDAALEIVARSRAAVEVEAGPPPDAPEPVRYPFRVGDRLARRLGGRR